LKFIPIPISLLTKPKSLAFPTQNQAAKSQVIFFYKWGAEFPNEVLELFIKIYGWYARAKIWLARTSGN
jgi:hypothetical protein